MAKKPRERTQRRHVREKATIDHLVRDVYEPKTPDEKHTERSLTTSTSLPVEDQVTKEWKAALARIPRFFGDKRQITSVTELPMPTMPSPPRLRKRPSKPMRRPAPRTRSISPAARRSPTHQRIRLTRSSICWTDPAGPEPRAGSALAQTLPSTLSLSLTGRRRSRASSTRSRRRRASVPRKYAWKPRETAANRTEKFWFRNTTSAPVEPPISAKNSASISARSPISVSRLFQTRAAPARRR